jgi:hypothetical protein
MLTAWQRSFRAIADQLPTAGLEALRLALASDDRRLITGATTSPPPLQCCADWPVEAACPIAFAAWQGGNLQTVGEVEEAFARVCFAADQQLGEQGGIRYCLNHVDDTPRPTMRRELLVEVDAELMRRGARTPTAA